MRKIILIGGDLASGKSTYAEMLREINPTFQRVCPDLIRKAFYGDENIQGDGKRVFETAYHDIKEYAKTFEETNEYQVVKVNPKETRKKLNLTFD